MPTKICPVKAMVFPVVMYGYKCWTIKKAEHGRNDAFQMSQLFTSCGQSIGVSASTSVLPNNIQE